MGIFDDKVVIVTGAARGLGRDYSRYFAQDGANVVLADVKGTDAAAEEATAAGRRCIGVECDVTDWPAWRRWSTRRRPSSGASTSSSTTPDCGGAWGRAACSASPTRCGTPPGTSM